MLLLRARPTRCGGDTNARWSLKNLSILMGTATAPVPPAMNWRQRRPRPPNPLPGGTQAMGLIGGQHLFKSAGIFPAAHRPPPAARGSRHGGLLGPISPMVSCASAASRGIPADSAAARPNPGRALNAGPLPHAFTRANHRRLGSLHARSLLGPGRKPARHKIPPVAFLLVLLPHAPSRTRTSSPTQVAGLASLASRAS